MSDGNFGLKIGLEGEKEFKKALSDINSSFKVLGSEMKLVSSQFDKNDSSVKALTDTTSIEAEISELLREIEIVSELTRKCVEKNSTVAQDQKEFNLRYNGYVEKYETLKERYDSLAAERDRRTEKAKAIDRFIHTVESRDGLLTEFDPHLWMTTVETVTIANDRKMLFRFFDGTEIEG